MDPLSVIYNENQWRINSVSPLNNMHYNEVKLKQYATLIKQNLVRTVYVNTSVEFTVTFDELPYLKYSSGDSSALQINIKSKQNSKIKTVYEAILLSWGKYLTLTGAIHLPYMLERGEQRVGVSLKSSLQNIFDCNIKEYNFSQLQLLQIGLSFLKIDTSKNTELFILGYKVPQTELSQKVSLKFELGDIQSIWNRIDREISNELESVQVMYQNLQNQIFHMLSLDITIFNLDEIILPKAEVRSNGVVRMKIPQAVNALFIVLDKYHR